ncbi:hypothetical protein OAH18_03035 [bacterium]|nr:hypothetical protein [bacterium]
MALKWIIRILAASAMVGVVHAFMIGFAVPTPAAWYLGAMIYAGLVAVLFSKSSIVDKVGIYFVFAVVTVVGAVTVCPCTGAHFFIAPIAGMVALGLIHGIKSLLPQRWLAAADATEQLRQPEPPSGSN